MRVLKPIKYSYVNSALLNQIKKSADGKTWWEWVKAQCKIGAILTKEGSQNAKKDLRFLYNNIRMKLSAEEERRVYEIKCNLWKLPMFGFLLWLGGPPLVIVFKKKYPILTPTWYLRDAYQKKFVAQIQQKQRQTLNFFIDCGSIRSFTEHNETKLGTTLSMDVFNQMSYGQRKKVIQLCFGQAFDGTNIIKQICNIKLNYLLSPAFSSFLIQENLKMRLKGERSANTGLDLLAQKVLKQASELLIKETKGQL